MRPYPMKPDFLDLDPSTRIHAVRGLLGAFHLIYDTARREAILIDTGLGGELPRLTAILKESGLGWSGIKAIFLTHGHLDHTGNLARLKEWTGAPVLGPYARATAHRRRVSLSRREPWVWIHGGGRARGFSLSAGCH